MKKLYYFLFALLATATVTAQTPAAQVPVTQAPAAQAPATQEAAVLAEEELSGQCGENLYWHYADGTLTITGSGEMFNYTTSITGVAPNCTARSNSLSTAAKQGTSKDNSIVPLMPSG